MPIAAVTSINVDQIVNEYLSSFDTPAHAMMQNPGCIESG